jgi:hypothetical protein
MICKPEEAKTKWCPMTKKRINIMYIAEKHHGEDFLKNHKIENENREMKCLVEECMWWKWWKSGEGYCGVLKYDE